MGHKPLPLRPEREAQFPIDSAARGWTHGLRPNSAPKSARASISLSNATAEAVRIMMRSFLSIMVIVALGAPLFAADSPPPGFYVQIVRGANDVKAKGPGWKPIGPKLADRLKRVVPWNYYWETARQEFTPSKGKPQHIEISSGRELEIVSVGDHQVELWIYRNGVLRRKSKVTVNSGMTIMGGDATGDEGWFVVLRKDKPTVN